MKRRQKVIVVMPAYNAESTLAKTYNDIPHNLVDKIILVDDASSDKTAEVARKLKLHTIVHKKNKGYGGNQKTCYKNALSEGADIVVMLHPDYQYDPKLIGELIEPIKKGRFDIMLGSRITTRREVLGGGMPIYKYIGNRFLTIFANIILGVNLSEYHTGFRAYTKEVLKSLPFNSFSDDFIFDQEFLIAAIKKNHRVGEIHVPTRYFKEASSISFSRSVKYGIETVRILVKTLTA